MIEVNYIAIVIAAVLSMGLGMLWYGPLFGKPWQAMMGITPESMKTMALSPMQAMVGGFITALVMAYVPEYALYFASAYLGVSGVSAGLSTGFWNWLAFVMPVTAGVFLWEGKPFKLFALNAGYFLVSLCLMGIVLSMWA